MRVAALVLALLAALPAHGQEKLDVQHATVQVTGGPSVEVEGGCWLSTEKCIGTARELKRLRAENADLKKHAGDFPTGAVVLALLLGAGAGFTAARLAR